jgi:tetratricopeptide (TPR) repeat protein
MIIWSPAYYNALGDNPENLTKNLNEFTRQINGRGRCLQVGVYDSEPADKLRGTRFINLAGLSDEDEVRKTIRENVESELDRPQAPLDQDKQTDPLFPGFNWDVPYNGENPLFISAYGTETLNDLYGIFIENESNGPKRPQLLVGPTMMGKTEIAVKYAYQNRRHYKYVFWIDARDRAHMIEKFQRIAFVVQLKAANSNGQVIVDQSGKLLDGVSERQLIDTVKRWLLDTDHVLLILDRCDNLNGNVLGEFIPQQARSHILLTSCVSLPQTIAESVIIQSLLPKDGAKLLLKFVKNDNVDSKTIEKAEELSEAAGGIPVALTAMGIRMQKMGISSIQVYAETFKTLPEIRSILSPDPEDQPFQESIAGRWSSQFDSLQQRRRRSDAMQILKFCAFLSPEAIPIEIVRDGASVYVPPLAFITNETILNEALSDLLHFSLIDRNEGEIHCNDGRAQTLDLLSVNRLLQIYVREFVMSPSERSERARSAVSAVAHTFPNSYSPITRLFVPHARICDELIEQYKIVSLDAGKLLIKLGDFDKVQGNIEKALEYYERAEEMLHKLVDQQLISGVTTLLAMNLKSQGELCQVQGRYAEAEQYY